MITLKLDNSPETNACVQALAEKFNATYIMDFASSSPFGAARKEYLDEIVCLSHSNTGQLGNYTAESFVERFHREFEQQVGKLREDKLCVKHIHLIGCEVGMKTNGTCLAQEIADRLYKKGYTKVLVHAVASPEKTTPHEMRVKVITQSGANFTSASGDVEAYWLNEEQANKLKEIEEAQAYHQPGNRNGLNLKKEEKEILHKRAINAIREQKIFFEKLRNDGQYFLHTHDIRSELLTKQNTFHFDKKELQEDPKKIAAIAAIDKHLCYLENRKKKKNKEDIKQLTSLKGKLENDLSENWKRHVEKALNYFTNKRSSTRKMLLAIRDNPTKLEKIATKQPDRAQKSSSKDGKEVDTTSSAASKGAAESLLAKHNRESQKHLFASQRIAATAVSSTKQNQESNKRSFVSRFRIGRERPANQTQRRDTSNIKSVEYEKCEIIKIKIREYIKQLDIEAKNHCCLSFFGHLGKYKLSKFSDLEQKINGLKSIAEIESEIKKLYLSSWFLTSGGSHRAKNLITNILHGQYERGIDTPEKGLTKEDFISKLKIA